MLHSSLTFGSIAKSAVSLGIAFSSAAHSPRSINWQRLLQKGPNRTRYFNHFVRHFYFPLVVNKTGAILAPFAASAVSFGPDQHHC